MIPNNIKNIPTENLLIKNFFVLGIDSDKILDTNYFANIKSISDTHKLKPSVLSIFPSFQNNNIYINENMLLRHCFPNGFYIKKYSQFPLPEHFCFELNNYPLNSRQSKLYFTCLSFYEPIDNYNLFKIIHDKGIDYSEKFLMTQGNKNNENASNNSSNNNNLYKEISSICTLSDKYYIEKVIGFTTIDYFPKTLTKILYLLHGRYTGHFNEIQEPIEKTIESLIFSIPSVKFGKSKLEIILFKKQYYFEYLPVNSVPLSSIEINKIFERYKISDSLQIFKSLLLEEPILFFSRNISELTVTYDAFLSLLYPFTYVQPHCGILPNNSFGLIESCDTFIFGINQEYDPNFFKNNEISVFNKKIIIIDLDHKNKYIYHQIDVIQIDLDNDSDEDDFLFDDNNEDDKDEKNQSKKKYKNYRNYNEPNQSFEAIKEEEIDLPTHYKKKTYNFIMDYLKILAKNQNQSGHTVEKDNFNQKIKEQFAYFLVSIMLDYSHYIKQNGDLIDDYLMYPENDIKIEKLFDIDGFINNSHKVDELFYRKFFHTKLFKNFIIKKIYPITLQDKIDILYFDERIADKKNKSVFENKINTPFIYYQFNSYDQRIFINTPLFSFNEINYIRNDNNTKKSYFNYFQVVINKKNSNDIIIKYPVFPKLLYDDIYFNKKYSDIHNMNNIPPLNISHIKQNIKDISNLLKNKEVSSVYSYVNYSLNNYNKSKLLRIDMKTILPNIWLVLNALSFNYCISLEEKRIRFSEIIEKLYEIEYIDVDVVSLILIIISKYGTSEQLLITFGKILKNKILLSDYTLHSFVITNLSKNFNSDMNTSKTNTMSSRSAILNKKDSKDMDIMNLNYNNLLKRGIYSHSNEPEIIDFGFKTMCPYCKILNQINYSIIMKQEGQVHGILLQCGNCQKSFTPRIKVNINEKIVESFNLMSCYDILEFLKNQFMTNNKFSIDVKNFHYDYPDLFWNAIFYFSINDLHFDFMTPYTKDISDKRINMAINKNNNLYQDLYRESKTIISITDNDNIKGSLLSNYKNPFIKMNNDKRK